MLQAERLDDDLEATKATLEGWQRKMWTAMPGIIQGPVAADGTVSVLPALKGRFRKPDGTEYEQAMPLLIFCPLVGYSGGGFGVTVPVAAGDECLVVFASRCIDGWWQSGGTQSLIDLRMHDLSDGFAIPGVRSKPKALTGWSPTTMQLRSDDGLTFIEVAPGGVINIKGDLRVTGAVIAGYGGADQVGLQTHKHTQGVDGHGDTEVPTDAPTAGT